MTTKTISIDRIHNSWFPRAALLVALVVTLGLVPAVAQASSLVHSSARSTAMGGAFTGLAKGVDAAKYNPANLGLDGFRNYGLEFASFGASITNNSFTLSDYNKYTGATLSTADKQDIMAKIPTEGLSLNADIEASAMSVALGSLVFSLNGVGSADVSLNRDIVDLLFNGNTYADTIDITGSYADAVSYGAASVSYGLPVYASGTRQLAVGATASYIHGIGVEKLISLKGLATTFATGFQGEGEAIIQTAAGGSGYALDLGAALKFNDSYAAGVRFENVLGSITWDKDAQEHGYIFAFDTATIDDFENDLVTSEDYTIDIASFSTTLPAVMNIGLAKTSGRLLWAVDWVQGFRYAAGASTKPRLEAGAEYQIISFLPVRAGFMAGGDRNTAFSFGSGFHFSGFYLDAAVITGSSLSVYSARGANLAVSTGILF